jgi:hypothetical protein
MMLQNFREGQVEDWRISAQPQLGMTVIARDGRIESIQSGDRTVASGATAAWSSPISSSMSAPRSSASARCWLSIRASANDYGIIMAWTNTLKKWSGGPENGARSA